MQAQATKARVINVFDMGLLGMLLGMSYAGAFHQLNTLM
jgi:hypothetical protein